MILSSRENLPPAYNFPLPPEQEILDNQVAGVPITLDQQGTHCMKEDVRFGAAAQDIHTSGNELSDLGDIDFLSFYGKILICW